MWTPANRPNYDRSGLRYLSDLTDEQLAIIAPLIAGAKRGDNKRTRCPMSPAVAGALS